MQRGLKQETPISNAFLTTGKWNKEIVQYLADCIMKMTPIRLPKAERSVVMGWLIFPGHEVDLGEHVRSLRFKYFAGYYLSHNGIGPVFIGP